MTGGGGIGVIHSKCKEPGVGMESKPNVAGEKTASQSMKRDENEDDGRKE